MKPIVIGCVAGLLLALSSSQVAAQPLAEIARREKLRREALAAKATAENVAPKVYTAADLRGGGRLTTSDVETPAPMVRGGLRRRDLRPAFRPVRHRGIDGLLRKVPLRHSPIFPIYCS